MSKVYQITKRPLFFLSDGALVCGDGVLHDVPVARWEDFAEAHLHQYFENGYAKFLKRLSHLKDSHDAPTGEEEKELVFMIEALIEAKRALHH